MTIFSEETIKIHEQLDLIEIDSLMQESKDITSDSSQPVSDLAFMKAPSLKTLGYSLHRVARSCLDQ